MIRRDWDSLLFAIKVGRKLAWKARNEWGCGGASTAMLDFLKLSQVTWGRLNTPKNINFVALQMGPDDHSIYQRPHQTSSLSQLFHAFQFQQSLQKLLSCELTWRTKKTTFWGKCRSSLKLFFPISTVRRQFCRIFYQKWIFSLHLKWKLWDEVFSFRRWKNLKFKSLPLFALFFCVFSIFPPCDCVAFLLLLVKSH